MPDFSNSELEADVVLAELVREVQTAWTDVMQARELWITARRNLEAKNESFEAARALLENHRQMRRGK